VAIRATAGAAGEGNLIRVVLVDDHAVLRAGLRALINAESDMVVVGEAADGQEAIEQARSLRPDVIVMDIAMPVLNGLEAMQRIVELGLPTRILVLTMHSEEQYLMKVLQSGGAGYLLKASADTELMEAIRTVHRGETFLYPSAAKMLLSEYLGHVRGANEREPRPELTERERDVLRLTVEGFSNQEIADRLYISPKTVDTYRARVMDKLQLRHRSELIQYALRTGLLRATESPL
jgi:DNA-binding NarL/FixJ family response regulator